MLTYFPENDFAIMINFGLINDFLKIFRKMFVLQTSFRGNDFATINNFRPKNFSLISFFGNLFQGNYFATTKIF